MSFMFEPAVYQERRSCLVERLQRAGVTSGIVLFPSNGESPINYPDNCYPFRQDSNWLYFVGLNVPDMLLVLDLSDGKSTLFANDITMDDMIWTGPMESVADLARKSGITDVRPLNAASIRVEVAIARREPVYCLPFYRTETKERLSRLSGLSPRQLEESISAELIDAVISMREIKEPREIAELEKAVAVSEAMHQALLRQIRPGWTGYEAAALVQYEAQKHGCGLSFATIATNHGETLHNHSYDYVAKDGDLVLLDAGAEVESGYAGDLTTTFPVGKCFDSRQAQIYDLLCKVFLDATSALAPGKKFIDVHRTACLSLARGLKEIGIMKGDPSMAVERGAHALLFPHGLGHMIGLDVHDMEGLGEDRVGYGKTMHRSEQFGLSSLRLAKELKPGMVHSMEPGIYFIPGLIEKWERGNAFDEFIDYNELRRWKDLGGMRMEEDWLMTPTGARRLGPAFDKSRKAIENWRSQA